MTETTTEPLKAGDSYWSLKAGFIWAGAVRARGERIIVTRDDIPEKLALVLDVDAQVARWGEQRLAVELPEGFEQWEHGTPEWSEQREVARRAAWSEPDPTRRAAALAAVEERFGAAGATSRTIAAPVSSPTQRAFEKQQQRLDNPTSVHRIESLTVAPDEEVRPPRRDRTVLR